MIVCTMDLFTYNHHILHVDEDKQDPIATSSTDDCMAAIMYAVNKYNDNKVHLIGAESYCETFAEGLIDLAKTEYNYNNLEVKIN